MTPVMPIQNALTEDYSHALVRVKTGQADEGREGTTQTLRGEGGGKTWCSYQQTTILSRWCHLGYIYPTITHCRLLMKL